MANQDRINYLEPLLKSESLSPGGDVSRLVMSIDLGATKTVVFVSAHFTDGKLLLFRISQWKGQEVQEIKVPTVILYDGDGRVKACGAEAITENMRSNARTYGWQYAEEFKCHLHPRGYVYDVTIKRALPRNVTIIKVYADFLKYVLEHTKSQLKQQCNGRDIWTSAEMSKKVEVVLACPNLWGVPERDQLRSAVMQAGLLRSRVKKALHFVEEGEASARFFLLRDSSEFGLSRVEVGMNFLVCDAGGSTVDISSYLVAQNDSRQLKLQEVKICPDSISAGGLRIDEEFDKCLRRQLNRGRLSFERLEGMVARGVKDFEAHAKRSFKGQESCEVAVDTMNEFNLELGIERGIVKVDNPEVEKCFSLHTIYILDAIGRQIDANIDITCIILTGGLGDSPYLQAKVKERFSRLTIYTAAASNSQAVSVGALLLISRGEEVDVQRLPRMWNSVVKRVRRIVGR